MHQNPHIDRWVVSANNLEDLKSFIEFCQNQNITVQEISSPYSNKFIYKRSQSEINFSKSLLLSSFLGAIIIAILLIKPFTNLPLQFGNLREFPIISYLPFMFVFMILSLSIGAFMNFLIKLKKGQNKTLTTNFSNDYSCNIISNQANISQFMIQFPQLNFKLGHNPNEAIK